MKLTCYKLMKQPSTLKFQQKLVQDFIQNLNYCIAPPDFATVLKWAVKLHKFTERIPRAQKKIIDLVYFTKCFKNLLKV